MLKDENKIAIRKILLLYIKTRLVLLIIMTLLSFIFPSINALRLFDNEHYLNIAKNGYVFDYQYAFFPLTALLIKYLGKAGFIIINQICVIASGYLLYLLSKKVFNQKALYFPSTLWFLSPISVFTCLFYSEALFVFLTLMAYYLYKNKKHYLILGITLGLSVMTRNLGSMLFFTIFIFMFVNMLRKGERFKNILITYIPATIISCIYPIYLYLKTGNALYFVDVQFDYWARINTNIFTIIFYSFNLLLKNPHILYVFNFILTFSLIGYIVYLLIQNRKNRKYYDIYLYMILTIIAVCSTIRSTADATTSFYRYLYGCFPIYFIIPEKDWCTITHILLTLFISIIFLLGIYFF